jgi:hypothetical protein
VISYLHESVIPSISNLRGIIFWIASILTCFTISWNSNSSYLGSWCNFQFENINTEFCFFPNTMKEMIEIHESISHSDWHCSVCDWKPSFASHGSWSSSSRIRIFVSFPMKLVLCCL